MGLLAIPDIFLLFRLFVIYRLVAGLGYLYTEPAADIRTVADRPAGNSAAVRAAVAAGKQVVRAAPVAGIPY